MSAQSFSSSMKTSGNGQAASTSGEGDNLVRLSNAPCCKWREHSAFCRAEDISQANFYAWSRKLRGDVNGLITQSAVSAFIDLGAVSGPVADRSTGHVSKPAMATATSAPTLRAIVNPSTKYASTSAAACTQLPAWAGGTRATDTRKRLRLGLVPDQVRIQGYPLPPLSFRPQLENGEM